MIKIICEYCPTEVNLSDLEIYNAPIMKDQEPSWLIDFTCSDELKEMCPSCRNVFFNRMSTFRKELLEELKGEEIKVESKSNVVSLVPSPESNEEGPTNDDTIN